MAHRILSSTGYLFGLIFFCPKCSFLGVERAVIYRDVCVKHQSRRVECRLLFVQFSPFLSAIYPSSDVPRRNCRTMYKVKKARNPKLNTLRLEHSGITPLTLRLLISYIYGAPSKARNANVVYIWTYVWQR